MTNEEFIIRIAAIKLEYIRLRLHILTRLPDVQPSLIKSLNFGMAASLYAVFLHDAYSNNFAGIKTVNMVPEDINKAVKDYTISMVSEWENIKLEEETING